MGGFRHFTASASGYAGVPIILLAALAMPAAGLAAPPANDDFSDRLSLQLGNSDTRSSADGSIEPGERLTANDPLGEGCGPHGAAGAGIAMKETLWWRFTGNGGPVTVSTLSSSYDTVLAVYDVADDEPVGCNDDIQAPDLTRPTLQYRLSSEMLVNTVAGREYAVQVGGCTPADQCGEDTSGNVTLTVADTPDNDDRDDALPIPSGGPVEATNVGGTLEAGEVKQCGQVPYAKTVWFRYRAPAAGTAAFSAAGFDTVLTVYRAGATTPLGCNDDAVDKQIGGSRLPMSQPPGPPFAVAPGDYLIQVGGFHNSGFSTIAARHGPLSVQVDFTEDTDIDRDGVAKGRDCNDGDAGIRPGAPELPNNSVDENCDGVAALDRDRDGSLAPPAGHDCKDGDPRVHPGADEVPGNGRDDNCDGVSLARPVLDARIGARWHEPRKRYTVLEYVRVASVERGTHIRIRCHGKGCPWTRRHVHLQRARKAVTFLTEQRLGVGAKVTIRVTKPGHAGKLVSLKIRSGKEPLVPPTRVISRGRP